MGIFSGLRDNELLGCIMVVGFESRKYGYFEGIYAQLSELLLAGGTGPFEYELLVR